LISIADLTTPMTREQVERSLYDVLGRLGVSTTSWKTGAVVRAMLTATALLFSALSYLTASIARSGFLELATGDWLTLVARYVFNVERVEATFAEGEVTLTNTTGGVFVYDPEDLTVRNSTTDKSYRNTSAFVLNGFETLTVAVRAVESGSASTSVAGAIDSIESGPDGVNVSNAPAVVGQDEETDPNLRVRCLEKLGALSPNGPWDAYSYAARNATRADGSLIGVTRVRVRNDGYGNVFVYCATATGGVTGDANDPDTDLGAINEAIQRQATPQCVVANVYSATPVAIEVQIKDAIATRLVAFMQSQPISGNTLEGEVTGRVYQDAIRTAIGATFPYPQTFHVVVALPSEDVALAIDQVPVLGAVNGTIVQVAPPSGGVF
jgi:hypothetical protein